MDRVFFRSLAFFLLVGLITSIPAVHSKKTNKPKGQGIGVNYGLLGNNLPPPEKVVPLLKSRNIRMVRIFDPNPAVLNALRGSGIQVVVGTLNGDLSQLGNDPSFAVKWVQTNIVPYANSVRFRYVVAGNEVFPFESGSDIPRAMQNIGSALAAAKLNIPVTTAVSTQVLGVSYPPSQGAFSDTAAPAMKSIISLLASNGAPLLVNVYPFFAYSNEVRLDYALFTASGVVVQDGSLGYSNLFDSILDSCYFALEKVGGSGVNIVVSETGWPSGGGPEVATAENARIYNNNLIAHVTSNRGTPKRPGKAIETYIFALFNENQKPAGVEQNWGLYQPDMTEIYHANFP